VRIDDRSGLEVAQELDRIIGYKAQAPLHELILYGILAGLYIGFGAVAATTVGAYTGLPTGMAKFLSASVFCVGLILVVIPGSELFTGNILMTAGLVGGKVHALGVLRNWLVVYAANLVGSLMLALVVFGAGLMGTVAEPSPVGQNAAGLAATKIGLAFGPAFLRGVLCNMLVCLAVILALASRTTVGKILGIYFPIMTFVLCGFEHSVANMYFLPAGLLAKGRFVAEWPSMLRNLIPVTLGNVLGGMLVVVLHPARARRLARWVRAGRGAGLRHD
jgi:formate/nitrite transporter